MKPRIKKDSNSVESNSVIINEKRREVFLFGEVNGEKAGAIVAALREFDRSRGPITMIISSTGGYEGAGWTIYDALRLCKNKTVALCYGECQSIATLILQGCDQRLLAPNCRFMIHNGSIAMDMTTDQLLSLADEVKALSLLYYGVLAGRSGGAVTSEQVKALCEMETFFSAKETVEYGFADGIMKVVPKTKRTSTRKKK
jgi:ATP-dependent Clp protease protease subunit